jgi:putative hydrolase of the HAD superfamily
MAIRAVFFDAAGTLIKPAQRVGESYAAIAKNYGMDVSLSEVSGRFRDCFDSAPPLAFPGRAPGEFGALERNWWKALVRRVFEPWGPFERFDAYFAELFEYFAQPESWTLYPEVLETLSMLKERGLILDVISNFDARLLGILNGLGAGQWFDEFFISSRVGYAKPDRRIFAAALGRHGLNPENAVHIGDSEANDLRGALDAGLRGILVARNGKNEAATRLQVTSLGEIFRYLKDE